MEGKSCLWRKELFKMVHGVITRNNRIKLGKEKLTIYIKNETLIVIEVYQSMISQRKGWKIQSWEDLKAHWAKWGNMHRKEHSDTGSRNGWMTYKKKKKKIGLFLTPGPGNYCPINLTSLPIKIMEYKDRENIMKLLEDNGIMSHKEDGVEN